MFCGSQRLLQRAHGVERFDAEFGLEAFLLALPDAVLAGAGTAHRLCALDQAMHELLAARHLFLVVDVADPPAVEMAVEHGQICRAEIATSGEYRTLVAPAGPSREPKNQLPIALQADLTL